MNLIKIASIISLPLIPVIYYFLKKRSYTQALQKLRDKYNSDIYQYKLVFVTQLKNESCRLHFYKRLPCGPDCSHEHLDKIRNFLQSAKSTISLFMYHLTIETIADTIIYCTINKNIKVRCICDQVMSRSVSSKYRDFVKYGIEVKIPNQLVGLMHHKAIIVDGDMGSNQGKVLSGSMNMTVQAITQNWDMFVLTNNRDVVARFNDEFEYLWGQLTPLVV